MIVAATGHRPDKLGTSSHSGYLVDNPLRMWLRECVREHLQQLRPLYTIIGMALGFDQDFAEVSVELGIPFIAAIPFPGQELAWRRSNSDAVKRYRELLAKAYEVVVVSEGPYAAYKMQIRNEWMVDHCNIVIAAFDGSPGGTANCVNYANRVRRTVMLLNPQWYRDPQIRAYEDA